MLLTKWAERENAAIALKTLKGAHAVYVCKPPLLAPQTPKLTELSDSQWEAEIPCTVKKNIQRHMFRKKLWHLNLRLSQNTANESILDILFNIQPPSNIPRMRRSVCWIYYSFTKWVFLTVIFSVNNNTGVWSSL